MFRGTKDVFKFTFYQATKGKGYKAITIGMSVLILIVSMFINIIPAIKQLDGSSKSNTAKMGEDETSDIEQVYVINNAKLKGLVVSLTDGIDKSVFPRTNFIEEKDLDSDELLDEIDGEYDIVLDVERDDAYKITCFVPETYAGTEAEIDVLMDRVLNIVEQVKYKTAGVSTEQVALLNSDIDVEILEVGKVPDNIATLLIKYIAPMACALILYIMVLFYGQSINKVIIAEKTSKLMEMMLTAVSPYAIVAGKILAMACCGILQFSGWIISGMLGYSIGNGIAVLVNLDYTSSVNEVIDILKKNVDSAFSVETIIIGILLILIGFVMYCVLSGLIASCINKAEDLSKGTGIYQVIVVFGFFMAYIVPMSSNKSLSKIIRIIPFTSAYILPADVIIGNVGVGEAITSSLILIITVIGIGDRQSI